VGGCGVDRCGLAVGQLGCSNVGFNVAQFIEHDDSNVIETAVLWDSTSWRAQVPDGINFFWNDTLNGMIWAILPLQYNQCCAKMLIMVGKD